MLSRMHTLNAQCFHRLQGEELICDICLSEYSSGPESPQYPVQIISETGTTDCSHIFCRRCIETLFLTNASYSSRCPVCRAQWFQNLPSLGTEHDTRPIDISMAIARHRRDYERFGIASEATRVGQDTSSNAALVNSPTTTVDDTLEPLNSGNLPEEGPELRDAANTGDNEARTLSNRGRIYRLSVILELMAHELETPNGRDWDANLASEVDEVERYIQQLWEALDRTSGGFVTRRML
jgi:hypothetical protein